MRSRVADKLAEYEVTSLWHFTDQANLPLIADYGLLALTEIDEEQIDVPIYYSTEGSRATDRKRGLDEFVRLTFIPDHPMLFRAIEEQRCQFQGAAWVEVDSAIVRRPDVRYSLGVAFAAGVELLRDEAAARRIDFDALFHFKRMNWKESEVQERRQPARKCEILVRKRIQARYLRRAYIDVQDNGAIVENSRSIPVARFVGHVGESQRTGQLTAFEAATQVFGSSVEPSGGRLKRRGWFYIGRSVVDCPVCEARTEGFRCPYKTTRGRYHYWALLCRRCSRFFEPKQLGERQRRALYKSSKHRPVLRPPDDNP